MKGYAFLGLGLAAVSVFAKSAYAQLTADPLGGMAIPVNNSELILALMENNIVWMAPAAVAGIVIYKLRSNRK